jgi:hypothetical protein
METFTKAKPFIEDPYYWKKRKEALSELDLHTIDEPIVDIIRGYVEIPYCYSLQSCYGHFIYKGQLDPKNIELLTDNGESSEIKYRIAYIAFCIQNSDIGSKLYYDLESVTKIDSDYIQFGSADWFWQRNVNSYVLQVEPNRYKMEDSVFVSIDEALHLQKVRDQMFKALRMILNEHLRLFNK